jgi:hypothetical protein
MSAATFVRRGLPSSVLIATILLGGILPFAAPRQAAACASCPTFHSTLKEDIDESAVAVICRLTARPDAAAVQAAGVDATCTFEVVEILKGAETLAAQPGAAMPQRVEIIFFGDQPIGTKFLAFAVTPPNLSWNTPTEVKDREIEYLRKLLACPAKGPERLTMFFDYLEAPERILAEDAYEEFARAPYADLQAAKPHIPRERLLRWIADVNVLTAHRRQYVSMLSCCALKEDLPTIEALLRSEARTSRVLLDALVGCHLVLRGADGVPLIEDLFLRNKDAELVDSNAAIVALRFVAAETNAVPQARINQAYHVVLDRPQLADLVIPDLSRAQDWSAVPKLTALFKSAADDGTLWNRVAIASYLRVCPTPAAAAASQELELLDPEAFRRAAQLYRRPISAAPASESSPAGAQ